MSPGLVSPLSLEVIILRFLCLSFIPLLFLLVIRWNFDRVNWARFFLGIEISKPLSSFSSVDAALGFLNDLIHDAANNFTPQFFLG